MYSEYRKIVQRAIDSFNNDDDCKTLVKCDVSERDYCAQLLYFIKNDIENTEFFEYSVNIEYNRGMNGDLNNSKKLDGQNISLDLVVNKIQPDSVLGFDNLICIEMKKEKRPYKEIMSDKKRLNELTDINKGFCYKAGFMILVCQDLNSDKFGLYIESEYSLH